MKQINRKQYKKYLDQFWSVVVHVRDNRKCQYRPCGRTGDNAHHIFSKGAGAENTRWNLENGILLCRGHHKFIAHTKPEKFRQYLIETHFKSADKYEKLYIASCMVGKQDLALWELFLLKELGKLVGRDILNEFLGLPISVKIKKLKEIKCLKKT